MLNSDADGLLAILLLGLILGSCGALQALVGFAAATFAIPILMLCGYEMPEAQVIIITAMFPQNVVAVWQLRKTLTVKDWFKPALIRLAFLPLGLLVMSWMQESSKPLLRPVVGAVMLAATLSQCVSSPKKKEESTTGWMLGTFSLSGFLQGLCGMSGAPLVLWCYARPWPHDKVRALLFTVYLTSFLPQWLLLYGRFGSTIPKASLRSLVALPLILLGTYLGLKFARRVPDHAIRRISYSLLILFAAFEILTPLFYKQ
ncbi:MAG: hypothetical protein RLY14_2637 [Planctomycetota bacterium]|jgi:uncharacterized membrane protein YfcA